jgi:UDP-2,3-diacylglucosamine hydrolase
MASHPRILLLSDLHLPNTASPLREAFLRFLTGPARGAAEVYILGDIFEYWIGDDVGLREYAAEAAALRALTDSGTRVLLMHGNRDFMFGRRFARAAGAELLHDPVRLELCGQPTLLSHGDIWCTDDHAYQRWRRASRNPLGQAIYLLMPVSLRQRVAHKARAGGQTKPMTITDVNQGAIRAAFTTHKVDRIIHGHTHRPAEHDYEIDGRSRLRIVLADWRPGYMEYLECVGHDWRRVAFT